MQNSEDVVVGPWGKGGERYFYFKPNGKITLIIVQTGGPGNCIVSIQFRYTDSFGKVRYSQRFGGNRGLPQSMDLEDDEEIIKFGGTYKHNMGDNLALRSLFFKTNKKKGKFGNKNGKRFTLPVKKGKFVGFHGSYGEYLNSIGAILAPK